MNVAYTMQELCFRPKIRILLFMVSAGSLVKVIETWAGFGFKPAIIIEDCSLATPCRIPVVR